jgi:hypothetical protein
MSTTTTILATGLVTGLTSFTAIFLQQELGRRGSSAVWLRDRRLEACSLLDELTTKLHELCNLTSLPGDPSDIAPEIFQERLGKAREMLLNQDVALAHVVLVCPQQVRNNAGALTKEIKKLVNDTFPQEPSAHRTRSELDAQWHRVRELRSATRESIRASLGVPRGV